MRNSSIIVLLSTLAACAIPAPPVDSGPIEKRPVWPAPPEAPRVEYLYEFHNGQDLGLRDVFSRRLRNLIAGGGSTAMVRPYSISVHGKSIMVSDPGNGLVHWYDQDRGQYRSIDKAGSWTLESPTGVRQSDSGIVIVDSSLSRVFILDQELELLAVLDDFERPTLLAMDQETGRLFIADTGMHRVRVHGMDGQFLFDIGARGIGQGEFNFPTHLAIKNSQLFVNDTLNHRVQIFSLDGEFLGEFGKLGDGSGNFIHSKGLAIDPEGHIWIADAMANAVQVFAPDGTFLLGFGRGGGAAGEFNMPAGVETSGHLVYVADSLNGRVQVFRYIGALENQ